MRACPQVAKPEDLETILEVGSWTWGWMEPPLGQLSFFLLTLQVRTATEQFPAFSVLSTFRR